MILSRSTRSARFRTGLTLVLLIAGVSLLASCASAGANPNNPNIPSYRLITSQMGAIQSAIGDPMSPAGGLETFVAEKEPNWPRAERSVASIKRAWPAVRAELERRASWQPSAGEAAALFQTYLDRLDETVKEKDSQRSEEAVTRVSAIFERTKEILRTPDVDWGRLVAVLEVFLVSWLVLTLAVRRIAVWRDRKVTSRGKGPIPAIAGGSAQATIDPAVAEAEATAAAAEPLAYSFDFLALRPFRALARSGYFPLALQTLMVMVFGYVIYTALVAVDDRYNNFGVLMSWSVFWPTFIMISLVLVGKAWCAVCPLGALSAAAGRFGLNRPLPAKLRTGAIALGLYVGIVWFVREYFHVSTSALLTGVFWIGFAILAVGVGLVYRQRAFCQAVCPIGIVSGLWSMLSFVEMRTKKDVCASCRTFECVRGHGDTLGCQMGLHPGRLESNRDCTLCMNCVKTCQHGSPQVRLRSPGKELVSGRRRLLVDAGFLLWVPVVLTLKENMEHYYTPPFLVSTVTAIQQVTGIGDRQGVWFVVVALFNAALLLGAYYLASRYAARVLGWDLRRTFATFSYLFAPLVLVTIGGHSLHYYFANVWGPTVNAVAAAFGVYVYLTPAALSEAGLMLIGEEFGGPVLYALGFFLPIGLAYKIAASNEIDRRKALRAAAPFAMIAFAIAAYFLWSHVSLTGGQWRW